jgi:hypothetical protein
MRCPAVEKGKLLREEVVQRREFLQSLTPARVIVRKQVPLRA